MSGSEYSYPTYESVRQSGRCYPSTDFLRLRWYLTGTLPSAKISVLESAFDSTSPQTPYYQPSSDAPDSDSQPKFHPISTSPVTIPPVSSITVEVSVLDSWAEGWDEMHWHCSDDEYERVFAMVPDSHRTEPPGQLVRCCDTDRPGPGPSITVTPSSPGGFVTIHDYITAVHPWLLAREDDLRSAITLYPQAPLKPEFEMFLYPGSPSWLVVLNTKEYKGDNLDRWWLSLTNRAKQWAAEREEGR